MTEDVQDSPSRQPRPRQPGIQKGVLRIIYASRTHDQLKQVAGELKRSAYGHIRAIVLGSKDLLCINHMVSSRKSLAEKNGFCKSLAHSGKSERMCSYFKLEESEIRKINAAEPKNRADVRKEVFGRLRSHANALQIQ